MLLLASASPARHRLLKQAGIPHRIRVSGIDESRFSHREPAHLVRQLSQAKAEAVLAAELDDMAARGDGPGLDDTPAVLGCDSVLEFEGESFGKPKDAEEATLRWKRMAGHWGALHTGHCFLPAGTHRSKTEGSPLICTVTTRVLFAPLDARAIEAYVATGEPMACAGGFALEGRGGLMVERIEGCFSNVIGLSLPLLRSWLQ